MDGLMIEMMLVSKNFHGGMTFMGTLNRSSDHRDGDCTTRCDANIPHDSIVVVCVVV
jgi:hypothetical protein